MTRSELQSSVIQSIILASLSLIISYEIGRHAPDSMWEDPVVKNFTSTFNSHVLHIETIMTNSTHFTPNTASLNNNATFNALSDSCSVPESFYLRYFPREVFIYALLSPLAYYWQIYLEQFFPTRSRGVVVDYEKKEKAEVDANEDQEEEVVKRWIAQGRVRGSSVSWWNTFVKWVLDMTFARFFFAFLGNLIESFLKWESWETITENIFWDTLTMFFSSFIGITPITSLIGFVVVPAPKRLVFEAGVDMIEGTFVCAFYCLAIPWMLSTWLAQGLLSIVTESMIETSQEGVDAALTAGRLLDEL